LGHEEADAMSASLDLSKVVPSVQLAGDDEEDTRLLRKMLRDAEDYLEAYKWCAGIVESYFGIGVGGVVAVFLFKIVPAGYDVDEWIWVIAGDLPPAYITTESAPNPACALDGYIGAMEEWVEAVRSGKPISDLIPVNAPATSEFAGALETRLKFLDREILSHYKDDLAASS
jgi:hypothetical protein